MEVGGIRCKVPGQLHAFLGIKRLLNDGNIASLDYLTHFRTPSSPNQAFNALAHSNPGRDLVGRFCLSSTLPLSILFALLVLSKCVEFVSRDLFFVFKYIREALRPYTQVCCKTRMEAAVEDSDDTSNELQGSPTQGGISKRNLRVNVYPPYSRRCEIAYPNKAAVPNFPSERYVSSSNPSKCDFFQVQYFRPTSPLTIPLPLLKYICSGWEVEGDGEGDTPRSQCVKLVKRWTPEELSSSMAPPAASKGTDGAEAENGGPLFKKTWEVIQEEGGLSTYRIEDNKMYAEVLLVRSTLHLSAKSLLGIETHRLDWSRLFTMRELKEHGEVVDGEDEDDEDEEKEGKKMFAEFRRKRKDKKEKPKVHVDGDGKAPPLGS